MNPALFLGIIALIIGVSLRYWINRRKFYRRNPMGVEGFSSYEKSVVTIFLEGSLKWISFGLIIFGLLMLWSYSKHNMDRREQIEKKGKNINSLR